MIILTIVCILSITIYEFSAITVTKKVSSSFRVIIEIFKVILVWIFEIVFYDINLKHYKHPKYVMVFSIKMVGYIIIIFGNLVLNEIIQLKCCELNRYYGKNSNSRQIPRRTGRKFEHHQ